jgi:glutathione synthase/RimK-type ligase-like ATP-grasp enzyme
VPFIAAARDRGFATVVFDRDPAAPGAAHAAVFHPVSTHDTRAVLQALDGLDLAGCFTYSSYEGALLTTAAVVERHDLRGLTRVALDRMWDKPAMLEALGAAGLAVHPWTVTEDPAVLTSFLAEHGRVVVKPARGGVGSAGVTLADHGSIDAAAAVDRAVAEGSDGQALLEAHVAGTEYGIDGVVSGGEVTVMAVSRKHTLPESPVMAGFATASPRDPGAGAAAEVAPAAIGAAGLDDSFFSLDVIVGDRGAFVVDVGPLLDAKIDRALDLAGLDPYGVAIDLVTTGRPEIGSAASFAVRFLYAATAGTVSSAVPGQVGGAVLELERAVGDEVAPPGSIADVLGWMIATGDDGVSLWNRLAGIDLTGRITVTP